MKTSNVDQNTRRRTKIKTRRRKRRSQQTSATTCPLWTTSMLLRLCCRWSHRISTRSFLISKRRRPTTSRLAMRKSQLKSQPRLQSKARRRKKLLWQHDSSNILSISSVSSVNLLILAQRLPYWFVDHTDIRKELADGILQLSKQLRVDVVI